jgi:23S rRNA pseudouridine2605 synthase
VPAERLQRALARAGYGSRRTCEDLIVDGKVTINGTVATIGDKVDPQIDEVKLQGVTVNLDPEVRYLVLNKPTGVVTTMRDPQGRRDIRALLPAEGPRVFPVGRLDRESEGLLLLTNDGELANRLTHPRYGIEKEYLAEVRGRPTVRHVGLIRRGVSLEDGPAKAVSARIVDARADRGQLRLVMVEGRKREVRRLLEAVGLPVTRLVRLRVGPVTLGTMKPGELRELGPEEVLGLARAAAKAERRARRGSAQPPADGTSPRYRDGPSRNPPGRRGKAKGSG